MDCEVCVAEKKKNKSAKTGKGKQDKVIKSSGPAAEVAAYADGTALDRVQYLEASSS